MGSGGNDNRAPLAGERTHTRVSTAGLGVRAGRDAPRHAREVHVIRRKRGQTPAKGRPHHVGRVLCLVVSRALGLDAGDVRLGPLLEFVGVHARDGFAGHRDALLLRRVP